MISVKGIHHITAIASDPQKTYDFYTGILGLRLVKKSVNQDDVATYHLFFGDKTGEPGMDLTFFTFQPTFPGVSGPGQVTMISLAVPESSLDFWVNRFESHNIRYQQLEDRFGLDRLIFYDHDNQRLELVGCSKDALSAYDEHLWVTDEINKEQAIHHFYCAGLEVVDKESIGLILDALGYKLIEKNRKDYLYALSAGNRAKYVEVKETISAHAVVNGAGTVHHIAFEVKDEDELLAMRQKILKLGLYPTEVVNRYYFKSVYFRTPAGILFELATSGPGFAVDEPENSLGQKLALPPFLESQRRQIEKGLEPIRMTII